MGTVLLQAQIHSNSSIKLNKGLHYNLINIKIHYYLHGFFTYVSILNQLSNWK